MCAAPLYSLKIGIISTILQGKMTKNKVHEAWCCFHRRKARGLQINAALQKFLLDTLEMQYVILPAYS